MALSLQRSLRRTLTTRVDDFLRRVREVQATKPAATTLFSSPLPSTHDVFVNNDTGLQYINVYGFDYDYTLANYNSNLERHIYGLGAQVLVEELGYPPALRTKTFDHDFVIKGLHFDRSTGYLLKVDQFGEFQNDSILLGREQVPAEVVADVYGGRRIPQDYESHRLRLLSDIFSLPEACLLADVVQHFRDVKAEFHPLYIYQDVRQTLEKLHANGTIHQHIMRHPERYLSRSIDTKRYLQKLAAAGKKTFLLSNSPYFFIDRGMSFIYGDDWKTLFDVVIASAGKPAWYVRKSKFRRVDESGRQALSGVDEFRRGEIYTQGSLSEFNRITGWSGDSVLYFGDHINSDLFEPQRLGAWKTAAVVKELEREISITSNEDFRSNLARLLQIEDLIAFGQQLTGVAAVKAALAELKAERNGIRTRLKQCINVNFGSTFRTYNAKTHYFYNIARYADIYTSRVSNLLHYPLDATFYTRRAFLPHEAPVFVS